MGRIPLKKSSIFTRNSALNILLLFWCFSRIWLPSSSMLIGSTFSISEIGRSDRNKKGNYSNIGRNIANWSSRTKTSTLPGNVGLGQHAITSSWNFLEFFSCRSHSCPTQCDFLKMKGHCMKPVNIPLREWIWGIFIEKSTIVWRQENGPLQKCTLSKYPNFGSLMGF